MNLKNKKSIIYIGISIIILAIIVVLAINIGTEKTKDGSKIKITKNEVSNLTLEDYSNSVFSMKKPKGWVVESAGTGIYYAIRAYDKNNSNNQIYLMMKVEPLLKSEASKKMWQQYASLSGNSSTYKVFTDAVVLTSPTTENFYKNFRSISNYLNNIEPTLSSFKFPTFDNFSSYEELASKAAMSNVSLDSKVLRATFTGDNSKEGEGMFMASIVNLGSGNSFTVDTTYYMVYDIMAITSDKDNFIDYKDILLESINSIEFSDSYVKQTIDNSNAQTKKALEVSRSIQASFDSYMQAWENRNKTYDIISQKRSDATLGYERVYDTETGDIYKAYNGFTDNYDGERYKSITDDMYTKKTSGYIEK